VGKSQIPIFNNQKPPHKDIVLNFGCWNFFDIWDLTFGISLKQ
jgi:hypothetical protein